VCRRRAGLHPDIAAAVLDRVLPDAARKTTGQLRARLAKLVIKADPTAAKRRYHNGLEGRRLYHGREDDGTASLSGRFLPAERAAAANGRIQAIADWMKDDGDERDISQLRADILLDLLQGHQPVPGPDGQDQHPLPGDPDHPDRVDDDDGKVELIVRRPAANKREVLAEAQLDTSAGLIGDGWLHDDGDPARQITLMNARVVALLARARECWPLAGDQLYVDLDLSGQNLPLGTQLEVGSAVLEVSAEQHRGCKKVSVSVQARCVAIPELEGGLCAEPPRHQHPSRARRRGPSRRWHSKASYGGPGLAALHVPAPT